MQPAIRPPVTLVFTIQAMGYEYVAESDQLEGYCTSAPSPELVMAKATADLEPWLGNHVTLEFRNIS